MDIQITFNQEFYEARIKKLLDCLLQSDFLSTNPYLLNDAALNDFFKKTIRRLYTSRTVYR